MKAPGNWIDWWDIETIVSHKTWDNNMEIFITATDPLLNYNSQDVILDIGCGPGYLATFLKDRVKEIHCVDTSQDYVERCKERFIESSNIFTYKLDENNYTDFSFFKTRKFSKIICQSVVQYYRSLDEIETLIAEVRRVALPGGQFLISDIPINSSKMSYVFGLFKNSFKVKYLCESLRLMFRLMTSEHKDAYFSLGLLVLTDEKMNELINKLKLDAEILSMKLTCNENRRHMLIRF